MPRWISCARSTTASAPRPRGWRPSAPCCPQVKFPADMVERAREPKVVELLQRETALFRARREALDSQIAVLRKQIRQTEDEAKALAGQIAAEARALKSQKEELALNEKLFKQNFVQKTRLMALERAVGGLRGALGGAPRGARQDAPAQLGARAARAGAEQRLRAERHRRAQGDHARACSISRSGCARPRTPPTASASRRRSRAWWWGSACSAQARWSGRARC